MSCQRLGDAQMHSVVVEYRTEGSAISALDDVVVVVVWQGPNATTMALANATIGMNSVGHMKVLFSERS